MAEVELRAQELVVELGGRRAVDGVSLRAQAGERLAILGPNGAGKSTLLRALAGLLPYRGRVWIHGDDASGLSPRERARRLCFVPQQSALRSALPVREVVAQGRYAHRRWLGGAGAGDRAAIAHALERTDVGALADRPFTALSVGEQRRVLLARGLASGARILCLDEPGAALDVRHGLELHALLRELAQEGYAIALVLHALDDALRHADRALLLQRGARVREGPVAEVIRPEPVREVYGVELEPGAALGFRLSEARSS
jgi:iron complex transport system ATP-binding protein